jgi:hypothetical protein
LPAWTVHNLVRAHGTCFAGFAEVIGLTHQETLLDQTDHGDSRTDTRLAPRLPSLAGLRVGLLTNTKPNASVLLSAVADELRPRGVLSSTMYAKGYFGTPVEESQIQVIARDCDLVVTGIGD